MIKLMRLIDIQSYKDVTFNFTDGVNVLEAPNETGKSVMFKIARQMCDGNWYGRGKNRDLIRRGCSRGVALFVVPHDTGHFKILFEIYPTYQVYRLFDGDEPVDSWKQDSLPKEIEVILGWSYDKDSKRLLNLCDQELEMPFVNSNLRANYESVKFIIKDAELERARFNIGNWINELSDNIDYALGTKNALEGTMNALDRVDVVKLEQSINDREKYLKVAKVAFTLLDNLNSCQGLIKPKIDTINSAEVDDCIKRSETLRALGLTLQEVKTLHKPTINKITEVDVEHIIDSCKILNSLKYMLRDALTDLVNKKNAEMKIKNVKECIEDFEIEHKMCPLCGSNFE